jgi:hypothetical protein
MEKHDKEQESSVRDSACMREGELKRLHIKLPSQLPKISEPREDGPDPLALQMAMLEFTAEMSSDLPTEYLDKTRRQRFIPVQVYTSTGDLSAERRLQETVESFAEKNGFSVEISYLAVLGSILKRFILKTVAKLTSAELKAELEKLRKAIELEYVERKQGLVDKDEAASVKHLMDAVKDSPNAVIQVGSLLVVKVTDEKFGSRVLTKQLTGRQVKFLLDNPHMIKQPAKLLEQLAEVEATVGVPILPSDSYLRRIAGAKKTPLQASD